jgi:hypothetical protein
MMPRMLSHILHLPVPDVIELLEFPKEFGGVPLPSKDDIAAAVRTSAALAQVRRQKMEVIELDNPSTTTFALFL